MNLKILRVINCRVLTKAVLAFVLFLGTIFLMPTLALASTPQTTIAITQGPAVLRMGTVSQISFRIQNLPAHAYIEALLYPKLQNRSELSYMSSYGITGYPLSSTNAQSIPLATNATSLITLPITITSTSNPSVSPSGSLTLTNPGCTSNCQGVYPVVFIIIAKGVTIATKALPFAILDSPSPTTIPLNVAPVLDESALSPSSFSSVLPQLANLLLANQSASLSVVLTGQTIFTGEYSKSAAVRQAIHEILSWGQAPNHQLIVNSISPLNLNLLAQSNFLGYVAKDLSLTQAILQRAVPNITSNQTFFSNYPITNSALKLVNGFGYLELATNANYVSIPDQKYTLTSGLRLELGNGKSLATLVLDQSLTHDLTIGNTNFERTALLTADLVSIFEDQPNDPNLRVLGFDVPIRSVDSVQLASNVIANISNAGIIKATSIKNGLAAQMAQAPINTWPTTTPVRYEIKPQYKGQTFLSTASLLRSYQSASSDSGLIFQLNVGLYSALGIPANLPNSRSILLSVKNSINKNFASIDLNPNRTVTMTSSRATIPISITSHSPTPLHLLLTIRSDRLKILGTSTRMVDVGAQTNTVTFIVTTKTLGIFQAYLSLTTPNGKVLVSSATLQIRSLTFTIAGTVLTGLAVLTLAFWWLRTLNKGRSRNKNLIPRAVSAKEA